MRLFRHAAILASVLASGAWDVEAGPPPAAGWSAMRPDAVRRFPLGPIDEAAIRGRAEVEALADPVEFHVALTGDDANPGTKAKLFATPERARDAIRELKRGEGGRSDAITCTGGEQVLIERCEIRNFSGGGVSLEGRNHSVRGCHIHHVGSFGVGLRGGDFATLKPARYSRAVNNNSGSFIITRHNAFIDCTLPYVMGNYCARPDLHESYRKAWEAYFQNHDLARLPHAAKYPELLRFWEEPRQYPDSNRFEGNLIYNPTVPLALRVGSLEMREGAIFEDGGSLHLGNNWVAGGNPGFVNTAAGDFRLSSDAEVFRRIMGFAPIPFAAIGPDHDILRH